jgi:hypothetical protein
MSELLSELDPQPYGSYIYYHLSCSKSRSSHNIFYPIEKLLGLTICQIEGDVSITEEVAVYEQEPRVVVHRMSSHQMDR